MVKLGVRKISLSISELTLESDLQRARDLAAARGLELVWNLPTPYYAFHPVALEAGDVLIEGAGRAWLYVEPDGDVRPTQGHSDVLGNFLRDPWETIWKK